MAGSFPDVPGYRFLTDIDGTLGLVYKQPSGPIKTISQTHMSYFNREETHNGGAYRVDLSHSTYASGAKTYAVFVFPEMRNITGYFIYANPSIPNTIETSTDTTNGQDGNWTTVEPSYSYVPAHTIQQSSPLHRSDIQTVDWPNVKAVRIAFDNNVYSVHLYGSIATTESPDRLRVVDLDGDDITAQLDFGNITQRSSVTKQFKVVNNSSTMTANNITVSLNATSDASPSIIGQYQISTDNVSYANAINIGNLAPGAESSPIWLRANILNNAQLGPWSARIIANPASWT